MSNFRFSPNDKQNGKVVYNAGIVNGIVALAVEEVEGTTLVSGKKRGISLFLEKDGIYADVSVIVKYGYNVPELAYRIQQSVKQNVETMTRYRVAKVDVHIQDVVFPAPEPASAEGTEEENEADDSDSGELNEKNPIPFRRGFSAFTEKKYK